MMQNRRVALVALTLAVASAAWGAQAPQRPKVLGHDRIFYLYGGTPEHLRCGNLVHSKPDQWRACTQWGCLWLWRGPYGEAAPERCPYCNSSARELTPDELAFCAGSSEDVWVLGSHLREERRRQRVGITPELKGEGVG